MEHEVYEKSIFNEEQRPVVYAGFWQRLAALILDGLVLSPLSIINAYSRNSWSSTAVLVITGLIALIYKPLLEYLYGATLGKKAVSIVVTNKAYGKPNLQEAVLRNIFGIVSSLISIGVSVFVTTKPALDMARPDFGIFQGALGNSVAVSSMLFLIYMADVIVFLADKQNRSLHDFIGKTYVIKK